MASFIKPSSFFLKFFALILGFQVSVAWSAAFLLVINQLTDTQGIYWIISDVTLSINPAEQTASAYRITDYDGNVYQQTPEELQNFFRRPDPVENSSHPNSQPAPRNLLTMDIAPSSIDTPQASCPPAAPGTIAPPSIGTPVFIPGIPSWLLHRATFQKTEEHAEGRRFFVSLKEQGLGYLHTAIFSDSEIRKTGDPHKLLYLYGFLNGRFYTLHYNEEVLRNEDKIRLDQLRQQLDWQEENNHPENTEENQDPIESDREEQDQEECADENTVEGQTDHLPVITVASGHGQNNTSENEEELAVAQTEQEMPIIYIPEIGIKDSQPNQDQ